MDDTIQSFVDGLRGPITEALLSCGAFRWSPGQQITATPFSYSDGSVGMRFAQISCAYTADIGCTRFIYKLTKLSDDSIRISVTLGEPTDKHVIHHTFDSVTVSDVPRVIVCAVQNYTTWFDLASTRLYTAMSAIPQVLLEREILVASRDSLYPGFTLTEIDTAATESLPALDFPVSLGGEWPFKVSLPTLAEGACVRAVRCDSGSYEIQVGWYTTYGMRYIPHLWSVVVDLNLVVSCGSIRAQATPLTLRSLIVHVFVEFLKKEWVNIVEFG